MAEEETQSAPKTPEEKAALEQKRELRKIRDEMKFLRKQAQEIGEKRKELEAQYQTLSAAAGLPPRKKRKQFKTED
jgi:hypothetical protein